MTGFGGGNPNPETSNVPAEYPERECPYCDREDIKHLPNHLREHCEATP